MHRYLVRCLLGSVAAAVAQTAGAGTDIFFNPLTQSAAVATPDHINELNSPYQVPAGLSQENLTSLREAENDVNQSMLRVPGAGTSASMIDMTSYSRDARYLFLPHETPWGAGVSRYDIANDFIETIWAGDQQGVNGNWANDFGAFDPSTWTTNDTLFLAEEWTAEGRVMEILNPLAPAQDIQVRELESIANVAHEGLRFSRDEKTLYFIDEWNSGSFYKFVMSRRGDYTRGQTFVLVVDTFEGDPAANWNEGDNPNHTRTGWATWVPITDRNGIPLTETDPFRNGPTSDPRTVPETRGGRAAADEVNGTPYGRPEDMEIGRLRNGREVIYVAVTSENAIYAIEELWNHRARVHLAADTSTPRNLGFPATTGVLSSPDNLAQDALGNLYIIEDAPNNSNVGGDVWFMRDTDSDGIAESLDHFMSVQVDGSEATGMIFNPRKPTEFVLAVMHPDSTALDGNNDSIPDGFGDALWKFDLRTIVPPPCDYERGYYHHKHDRPCTFWDGKDSEFVEELRRAGRGDDRGWD